MARLKLAPARESEIVEELAQHLDDHYQELLADGVSDADAEQLALAELSENDLFRELERVERKTPPEPIVIGTNRKSICWLIFGKTCASASECCSRNPVSPPLRSLHLHSE